MKLESVEQRKAAVWVLLGVILLGATSAGVAYAEKATAYNELVEKHVDTVKVLHLEEDKLEELELYLDQSESMVDSCAEKADLYKFAVEGLANKTVDMLESGVFADLTPEADAKKEADQIVCG